MLGIVWAASDGVVVFHAEDARRRRKMPQWARDLKRPRTSTTLANPKFYRQPLPLPEHLDVWCESCGPGRVATSAVRRSAGKVYLDIK
ncbi:hypothetical protein [Promicromonospora aerolata]|uniref:Uncharacterized protein n=1 Tax=Promicromonospora aerolata TaxID=195749 RepID=A0ABW4VH18_9MICO